MHFRIGLLKMIATSGFLTALCTQFVFGRDSGPNPAKELTAFPRPFTWFKETLFLRGMERR